MHLYNISIEAAPDPSVPQEDPANPVVGAYAICWVLGENPDEALGTVTTAILEQRWIPGKIRHLHQIDPASIGPEDESRQFITEALECGCSIILHTFPEEDAEDSTDEDAGPEDT